MRYLVAIAALMVFLKGNAQNVKYKDIAPMIESTSEEYAFNVLKEFLNKNLDHPAANLRIADFYIKQAQKTDPLIEYSKKQALAKQAQQRLFKANILIDEKEVKKNDAYYIWIATRNQSVQPEYEMVHQYIEEEKEEVNKILNSLPSVYNDFTNSVTYYDEAVKEFMEISGNYSSLKNLYLLYDSKLDGKFASLKSNYDSCLWYFSQYKAKTDTFPLKNYNQKLNIKPINVFRYDGLVSQVNFLKNDISVWNYAAWVDTVRSVINGEIESLRKLLNTNEERQDRALESLSSGNVGSEAKVVEVDKSILFNLLRYDYNNSIVPLLKYKESKQKLLLDQSNDTYYDTAKINIDRKLVYYNKMIYNIKYSDSLIAQFNQRFDPISMQKYSGFLDTYYDGIDGSKQYLFKEKNNLRKEFTIYGSLLKEGVESIKPLDSIGNYAKYKYLRIPLAVKPIDTVSMAKGTLFTTRILETADGGFYLTGVYSPGKKQKNRKAFLARLTPKKSVKWFNQYDIEIDSAGIDSNNAIEAVSLTNEGIAILIQSEKIEKNRSVTTLIHVLQDGNTKNAKRLNSKLFPRKILFNEDQNSFLICLAGAENTINNSEKNQFELVNMNGLGEETWSYTDNEIGGYIGMVSTQRGALIARNSVSQGKELLLTTVSPKGVKIKEKRIPLQSGSVNRIYKLNDASISLLGATYFAIINAKLEKIYP